MLGLLIEILLKKAFQFYLAYVKKCVVLEHIFRFFRFFRLFKNLISIFIYFYLFLSIFIYFYLVYISISAQLVVVIVVVGGGVGLSEGVPKQSGGGLDEGDGQSG